MTVRDSVHILVDNLTHHAASVKERGSRTGRKEPQTQATTCLFLVHLPATVTTTHAPMTFQYFNTDHICR